MRKILAALALFASPAMAAIETTTITGTVYSPNGGAYPGKVTCTLSHAGTASDGVNQQVVASYYTATIGSDGALSFTLVPNDVITPAGTWYSCEYTVQPVGGRRMTWVKTYSVATSPDPVALGAVSILDNPTLTLPTITGTANSMMATDGSGGLVSTPALQRAASGNAVKISNRWQINCGYADMDPTADGTADERDVWDYDCDGTQESSDINTAGDYLCAPADGVTQLATRLADLDGDLSIDDLVCGTLRIRPGIYTSGTTWESATDRVTFPWQGLHVIGSGTNSTEITVDFPRGTSVNPNQAGSLCGQTYEGAFVQMAGSYSSIEDLSIISRTIGPRTTAWGSGGDCDLSGAAEGTTDNSYLRLYEMSGTQYSNPIVKSRTSRLRILNSDQSCMYAQWCNNCVVEYTEAGFCGEHAFAGNADDILYDHLYGHDVANPLNGGYGLEIFAGTGATHGNQTGTIAINNLFERVKRGIWVYSSEKGVARTTIRGNTVRNTRYASTPGTSLASCIAVGGAVGGTTAITDTVITDNNLSDCGGNGIDISTTTNPINRVLIADNTIGNVGVEQVNCAGGECAAQIKVESDPDTTGVVISGNVLTPGVNTLTGMVVYGNNTVVQGNRLEGTYDIDLDENSVADGRLSGIYFGSTCAACAAVGNYLVLNQPVDIAASDTFYGIKSDAADDMLIDNNTIIFSNATEANHQNKIGVELQTGSDRPVVSANKIYGGMRAVASENGANNHVLLMGNYARNRYTTNGIYSLFQTTSSVATGNVCSTNTTGGAPTCILQEADTIMENNVAFGTVALAANGGTTVSGRGAFYFGDDTNAAFDTGTEVCAARGKTCKTVLVRTAAAAGTINEIACGTDAGATLANEEFLALCY